jgi:hypothetical protein
MPSRRNLMLMTATITPEGSPALVRVDPAQRLDDYMDALRFYLGEIGRSIDGIVFVENSNSDVGALRRLCEDRGLAAEVEFIANYGRESYPGRDRSFGEFKLLDHAMASSRSIAALGPRDVVWKVTGRYKVLNLATMVRTAPKAFDVYCDLRNYPQRWADLRFMAWTRQGYAKVFENVADRLGADPREAIMREYIDDQRRVARVVPRYRHEPVVDGVRGWDNANYAKGRGRLKNVARSISRAVAPWLWI